MIGTTEDESSASVHVAKRPRNDSDHLYSKGQTEHTEKTGLQTCSSCHLSCDHTYVTGANRHSNCGIYALLIVIDYSFNSILCVSQILDADVWKIASFFILITL